MAHITNVTKYRKQHFAKQWVAYHQEKKHRDFTSQSNTTMSTTQQRQSKTPTTLK
jgi:hypothetical protein